MIKQAVLIALRLVAVSAALLFTYYLYVYLQHFDWDQFSKFECFCVLFAAVLLLACLPFSRPTPRVATWLEIVGLSVILLFFLVSRWQEYGQHVFSPPRSDVGFTTVDATRLLFQQHENPYSSTELSPLKQYPPEYRGFYYGPVMMLGYLPTAIFTTEVFKAMSLVFLLISAVLLGFLVVDRDKDWEGRLADIIFAETAFLIPNMLWVQVLWEGANDTFPVVLLLGGMLALKKGSPFSAGLLVGLSFAAKFSPAVFLMPFLPIRDRKLWAGLALGFLPMLPFLLWDFTGFIRNVFLMRAIMDADMTSLYWITPSSYHWIFPVITVTAMLLSLAINFWGRLSYKTVIAGFTLLMIVGEVTFKQVHGNHLIWFFPVVALVFAEGRDRLFGLVSRPVR